MDELSQAGGGREGGRERCFKLLHIGAQTITHPWSEQKTHIWKMNTLALPHKYLATHPNPQRLPEVIIIKITAISDNYDL